MAETRVYGELLRAGIAGQATYRTSFVVEMIGAGIAVGLEFIEIFAIFSQVTGIAGLSFTEVVLVFSLASLGFALADLLLGSTSSVVRHVRAGTFDVLLLRPLPALGQLAAAELQLRRIGRVGASVVPLGIVLARLDIDWTPARALLVVLAPLTGAAVFGSLLVVAGALSFWLVEATEVTSALTYGSAYLAQWPTPVLAPVLATFFTFVVPAAFTGYLPALAILGRPEPGGLPDWLPWTAPLVALGAAALAGLLWRAGVRHYVGAGG